MASSTPRKPPLYEMVDNQKHDETVSYVGIEDEPDHAARADHHDPDFRFSTGGSTRRGGPSTTASGTYGDFLDKIWALELTCTVVAAACLIAVAAILYRIEDTPLDLWTFKIAPNTVLSILATVSKTTLLAATSACIAQLRWCHFASSPRALNDLDLYDSASRGSWGSTVFLFSMLSQSRQRQHVISRITCIGTLLVVLGILVDPFMQQILGYTTTAIPSRDSAVKATMPVSYGLSQGGLILNDRRAWEAIYGGLLDFDYPLPFQCPSGNCTWPAFASFGVCSDCQDAMPSIDRQCLSAAAGATDQSSNGCTEVAYTMKSTNLSLHLKNASQPVNSTLDTAAPKTYTMLQSVVSTAYPYGAHNATLFNFLIAQLNVDFSSGLTANSSTFRPSWNLTECSVRWCSRIYEGVAVLDGTLISPDPNMAELSIQSSAACNGSFCQTLVANDSAEIPPGANATYHLVLNPNVANIPKLLNFDYDVDAFANGTWDTSSVFSVTATMLLNVNISAAIAKVCTAYTDRIRAELSASVLGTVLVATTVIRVRWGWLILPAIVVASSAGFLLLVIVVPRVWPEHAQMLWKGSSLPLLCYPLNTGDGSTISRRPATRAGIAADIGGAYAQLRKDREGKMAFALAGS